MSAIGLKMYRARNQGLGKRKEAKRFLKRSWRRRLNRKGGEQ